MHIKGGCYYYVTSTKPRKWIRLCKELPKARILWAQIENGESSNTSMFNTLLDGYLVSKPFLKLAKNTRQQYENLAIKIREVFKGATIGVITPAHIAMWMDNHCSEIQANTGKAIISNVFIAAIRLGLVDRNPCKEIAYHQIEGRDVLITDTQYMAIWNRAEPHVQIAMDIAYLTGTRIQDILDIKLQDISADGLFIAQGKTKKRILFVSSPALNEVIARAKALPRPVRGMHLLCNCRGRPYPYETFNDHWLDAVRSVGLDGVVHFHDIRAKAATDAKEMGLDYQSLLGHSTLAMSDKYIRSRSIAKVAPLPKSVGASTI
jgi:integrase